MHRQKIPQTNKSHFGQTGMFTREIFKYNFTQGCLIKFTVSLLAPITVKIMRVTSSNLLKAHRCSRNSYIPYSCLSGSYWTLPPQLADIKPTPAVQKKRHWQLWTTPEEDWVLNALQTKVTAEFTAALTKNVKSVYRHQLTFTHISLGTVLHYIDLQELSLHSELIFQLKVILNCYSLSD